MQKYTSAFQNNKYDAIIIGSGLGGLTTAAILAKEGKKVLVLERHFVAGGFTHVFKRPKYEWDVGLHYVGDLNKNDMVKGIFDYVTSSPIEWEPMGEVYDSTIIEGDRYDFVAGEKNQIANLISYFPEEEKVIKAYFKLIKSANAASPWFFCEKLLPPSWQFFFSKLMRKYFLKHSTRITYDVLKSLTDNEKLIAVLCAQCGNYGLPPKKSSFAVHALIVGHYLDGGCYPVGGSSVIFKSILPVIEQNGGNVLVNAEVESILIENNTAVGVKMKNGDVLKAPIIVSNVGVQNTYSKLIDGQNYLPKEMFAQFESLKPSVSHIALYIGLNESDVSLKLPKNNFWIYNSYDFDEGLEKAKNNIHSAPPLAYISFPSAKDPSWKSRFPNRATIQILGVGAYAEMSEWESSSWMKRDGTYTTYKEFVKERFLEKVLSALPQIKDYIDTCEVSTPLTTKHFSNYQSGEIYGLEHTPERFDMKWLRPRTPIKNLYLTGQDTVAVGIASALFSGVLTSIAILKKNIYGKLKLQKN